MVYLLLTTSYKVNMGMIGVTEAGDAGWDASWFEKLQTPAFEGAIPITKKPGKRGFSAESPAVK